MGKRFAFSMLELIFVIVILGVLSKFGVEFLAQAYNNFIFSKINNTLQVAPVRLSLYLLDFNTVLKTP